MLFETKGPSSRTAIIIGVLILIGMGVNIFSGSIQEYVWRVFFFVLFAYLPINVFLKLKIEKNLYVKVLTLIVGLPFVLWISGNVVLLITTWEKGPYCGIYGSFPPYSMGWYKNPITQQCSYKVVRVCGSETDLYRFWFSPDQCTQEERERVFSGMPLPSEIQPSCTGFAYWPSRRHQVDETFGFCKGAALRHEICIEEQKRKDVVYEEALQQYYSQPHAKAIEAQWKVPIKTFMRKVCPDILSRLQ